MSAGLYGSVSGVNRKAKKLYANVGGVTRKIKGVYANVNGVVRKVYSAYDCKGQKYACDFGSAASYALNADGSGNVNLYSTAWGSVKYWCEYEFVFDEAISWAAGDRVISFSGNSSQPWRPNIATHNLENFVCWLQDANRNSIGAISENTSSNNQQFNASSAGSSDTFYFYVEATNLHASSSGGDAWLSFSWQHGDLYICGKQINSVGLI